MKLEVENIKYKALIMIKIVILTSLLLLGVLLLYLFYTIINFLDGLVTNNVNQENMCRGIH